MVSENATPGGTNPDKSTHLLHGDLLSRAGGTDSGQRTPKPLGSQAMKETVDEQIIPGSHVDADREAAAERQLEEAQAIAKQIAQLATDLMVKGVDGTFNIQGIDPKRLGYAKDGGGQTSVVGELLRNDPTTIQTYKTLRLYLLNALKLGDRLDQVRSIVGELRLLVAQELALDLDDLPSEDSLMEDVKVEIFDLPVYQGQGGENGKKDIVSDRESLYQIVKRRLWSLKERASVKRTGNVRGAFTG